MFYLNSFIFYEIAENMRFLMLIWDADLFLSSCTSHARENLNVIF